jgi:cytolysin (calcineurin-like family phosphatase)
VYFCPLTVYSEFGIIKKTSMLSQISGFSTWKTYWWLLLLGMAIILVVTGSISATTLRTQAAPDAHPQQNTDVTIVIVGDPQMWTQVNQENMQREVARALNSVTSMTWPSGTTSAGETVNTPDSVVIVGDLTELYTYPENWCDGVHYQSVYFERFKELFDSGTPDPDQIIYPIYAGLGDQDLDHVYSDEIPDIPDDCARAEAWDYIYNFNAGNTRIDPVSNLFAWDIDGVTMVMLHRWFNDTEYGHASGETFLDTELANAEATQNPVLLFQHYPPYNQNIPMDDQDVLVTKLTETSANVVGLFYGHRHIASRLQDSSVYLPGTGVDTFNAAQFAHSCNNYTFVGSFTVVRITDTYMDVALVEVNENGDAHFVDATHPAHWCSGGTTIITTYKPQPVSISLNTLPEITSNPGDQVVNEGDLLQQTITFTDPDADEWNASVDWGDGTIDAINNLAVQQVDIAHTYSQEGVYPVFVQVQDWHSTPTPPAEVSFTVTVNANNGPTYTPTATDTPTNTPTYTPTATDTPTNTPTNTPTKLPLAAPTSLTATAVSDSQINLAWADNASDESVYYVERSANGNDGWMQVGTTAADATSYVDSTLTCNTISYYRVRAYRASDGQYSAYSNVDSASTNVCVPADPPILLNPSDGSLSDSTLPTFNWTAVTNTVMYQIQIDNDADFTSLAQSATVGTTSYKATPLVSGLYSWRVRGLSAMGTPGPWSAVWTFTIDATRPVLLLPQDGVLTNNARPHFEWEVVDGAVRYHIQLDDNTDFSSPRYNPSTLTANGFTPPLPLGNGEWHWHVRARFADGSWTDWSSVQAFIIDTVKPARSTLTIPASGATLHESQPVFQWDAVSDAASYHIQADRNTYFRSADLVEGYSNTTQFVSTVPLMDGKWHWRVQAIDAAGNVGAWSVVWNVLIDAVPTPVPTLELPIAGDLTNDRTPTFDWSDEAGVVRYHILIDDDEFFGSPRVDAKPAASTYTPIFTPLADGVWYWKVQAIGADGNPSLWTAKQSLTVDGTRPARAVPTAPATGSLVKVASFDLYWGSVADTFGYDVQADTSPYFNTGNRMDVQAFTETTAMTFPFDGKWYWRVRAFDEAGNIGAWSVVWNVFVDAVDTPVPTLLAPTESANPTKDRVFTFDWTDEEGVKRYNLQVDNEPTFTPPYRINVNPAVSEFRNAVLPLSNGTWYWRVNALGTDNVPGAYTAYQTLVIDTIRPDRPTPVSPTFKEMVDDATPLFEWTAIWDADTYVLQIDRNAYFVSADRVTYTGIETSQFAIPAELYDRAWVWRVAAVDAAGNQSYWSAASKVLVNAVETPVPMLYSPAETMIPTKDRVFTFDWSDEEGVKRYNLQVDNEPTFTPPYRINVNLTASEFRNAALPLGNGTWYWRVNALGTDDVPGAYTAYRTLIVDIVPPSRPTLFSPASNTTTADNTPTFTWNPVADADVASYIIQIDKNYYFVSVEKIQQLVPGTSYTPGTPFADRRWFWRVAAVDAVGNVSAWSPFWNVVVDTSAAPAAQMVELNNLLVQREGQ